MTGIKEPSKTGKIPAPATRKLFQGAVEGAHSSQRRWSWWKDVSEEVQACLGTLPVDGSDLFATSKFSKTKEEAVSIESKPFARKVSFW